jgi:hypothetical protein
VDRHEKQSQDRQMLALAKAFYKARSLAAARILQHAKEVRNLPELIAWIEEEFSVKEEK